MESEWTLLSFRTVGGQGWVSFYGTKHYFWTTKQRCPFGFGQVIWDFLRAFSLRKCKKPLNKDFLEKYFLENQDNPYGIQNIMSLLHRGVEVTTATQFPPLFLPQLTGSDRKVAIERMVKLARKADSIFSSHRHGGVSAAIRKYDRSQFSHVAIYLGDGEVADIGPRGGEINSLYDSDDSTHFALYTLKADVSDESRQAIVKSARDGISRGISFNYWGIFLMFLRNRFKLPVMRDVPSVADMLFSNSFELVSYL